MVEIKKVSLKQFRFFKLKIAKYLELSNSAISKVVLECYKSRNSIHGT